MIIKAILFDGFKPEELLIKANEENHLKIKEKLKAERRKIINKLKEYKKAGLINSIHAPKNKKLKNHLKELVNAKRTIKKSLKIINQFYR